MTNARATEPPGRWALREGVRQGLVLSGLAFLAHLGWEYVQCPLLFEHLSYDGTWRGMIRATLGDIVLTWAVYGAVALVSQRWRWSRRPWRARQLLTLGLTAVALAVAIELRGLHTGRWRYVEGATVLPWVGVALAPILQLLVLTPLLVAAAECLTSRAGAARSRRAPRSGL